VEPGFSLVGGLSDDDGAGRRDVFLGHGGGDVAWGEGVSVARGRAWR
jgi:hypothetical protein